MSKTWLVAKREFIHNIKRPGFLFAAFGMPLVTAVVMGLIFLVLNAMDSDVESIGNVGYVDHSGVLEAAHAIPENFSVYPSEDAAKAAMESAEIGLYFVLQEDYLDSGVVRVYAQSTVSSSIRGHIRDFLLSNLSTLMNDPSRFDRIQNPVSMRVQLLDTGRLLGEDSIIGLMIVPIIFSMVFYMSTQTTSGYLMSGVVEEKANRIMEILITSITPMNLLLGKVIGLGALGLTQMLIWLGMGGLILQFGQGLPFLEGVILPLDLVVVALIYFFLTYFLFASIMGGMGAVAGSEQESRQFASIIALLGIAPFFFMGQMLDDPNGPLLVALTLIPFTSPLTLILRMSFSVVPFWQIALSIGILVVAVILAVVISARVFRWALLMYGKRPTPRELWRVIRGTQDSKMATVAQEVE